MSSFSGKFVLRVGPELHRMLRRKSSEIGVSLNRYCLSLIQAGIATGVKNHSPSWIDLVKSEWKDDLTGMVLFGSRARGEAYCESDEDILCVLKNGVKPARLDYVRWGKLEENLPGTLSPHFVELPRSPLDGGSIWFEAAIDGIVLWERDSLVSEFLRELRVLIAEGRFRRETVHGHGYWIRSGDA